MSTHPAVARLDTEIRDRVDAADTIITTAYTEQRDLTPDEQSALAEIRGRLTELRSQVESVEETQRLDAEIRSKTKAIATAIDTARGVQRAGAPTLLVSDENLRRHAFALAEGRSYGAVETRSTVTVAGTGNAVSSQHDWAQTGPRDPRHLIGFSGIQVNALHGDTAHVPSFTLPTGVAGVAESSSHDEYDDVVPVELTAVRHGRWSKVTAAVDAFDSLAGLSNMHAVGIARGIDLAAIGDIEEAAGEPLAGFGDTEYALREAINTVAATVYAQVEDLVVVGRPNHIAELQNVTPTNGPDVGSVAARFAGARLYPSLAASHGLLTVFAPAAFVTFMSPLRSATQINPADGSNTFGSWLHATGVACGLVGGAAAVYLTGS